MQGYIGVIRGCMGYRSNRESNGKEHGKSNGDLDCMGCWVLKCVGIDSPMMEHHMEATAAIEQDFLIKDSSTPATTTAASIYCVTGKTCSRTFAVAIV